MKIVLANPPVVRPEGGTPENDFQGNAFVPPQWIVKNSFYNSCFTKLRQNFGLSKGVRYGVRAGSRWPWTLDLPFDGVHYPFFMGYTAALLRKYGFTTVIRDAVVEREYSYERFIRTLQGEKPDIVLLECTTPTADIDIWFAKKISVFTEVALAGSHLVACCDAVMQQCPQVSYFLKGEYMLSALKMAQTLQKGVYEAEIVKDIDDLPFPVRDFPDAKNYYDPTMPTPRPQLQLYASKGCPFKCIFCLWPQTMYNGAVSQRSPVSVAEEIRLNVEAYGYKSIFFDDDTFNVGTERVSALCDELQKIGLPWSMMGRLDCSPDWLYDKMVDCGCVGMRMGVETFNIEVLKRVKKGLERHDFIKTLTYIADKHPQLMIHLTMMKNLPGQTEEMHQEDMELLRSLGFSTSSVTRNYQLSRCVPFPGTELYAQSGAQEKENAQYYDGSQ